MPGRGQPWKLGKGVADRIGTLAIADGSITEADLDSGLTSKVNAQGGHQIQDEGSPLTDRTELNFVGAGVTGSDDGEKTVITIPGGGGEWSKIGEFTVSSAQATMPVTFTASQAPSTYAKLLVIADFRLAVSDQVDIELTGPSGFTFTGRGTSVDTVPTVAGYESAKSNLIGTGLTFTTSYSLIEVTIQSNPSGEYTGLQDEVVNNGAPVTRRGGWVGDTNDATTLTGIVVKSVTQNFNIGSKVRVYKLSL